jgi:hypothetical protein
VLLARLGLEEGDVASSVVGWGGISSATSDVFGVSTIEATL